MGIHAADLTEDEILENIRTFTEKVKQQGLSTRSAFPDGEIDGELSNRGNKLKLGATKVHRDRVDGHNNDLEDTETVYYSSVKREIVKKRRLDTYNFEEMGRDENKREHNEGDEEEEFYPEDDLYSQIDLLKVLAPIQQPSEIVSRDSVSKAYKSEVLRHLAQQAIEIIEKEQSTVIQLSSLLDTFLCEDTSQLLEAKLQLPVYESSLNNPSKEENQENQEEDIDLDKRITRRQSVQDSADPFFASPLIQMDPDFGLSPEDAEEARQLSQIALQRSEEFIRNLANLRNGLSRAQYVKEKLLNWAKELNGDPDESDIYQKEVAAVSGNNQNTKGNASSFNISGVGGSKDDDSASSNETPLPSDKKNGNGDATSTAPPPRRTGRRSGRASGN